MATGKITKRSVDAMSPGKVDAYLWDDDLKGFGLKVTPAGAKLYLYQYRMGGRGAKTRRFKIGLHGGPWTPTTARDEAERVARLAMQGFDPFEQKVERERDAIDKAFDAYAERFISDYLAVKWKDDKDGARTLRNYVVSVLGKKPLPQLRKSDITAVLDGIPVGQVATRRKVYAILRKLIRWAISRGDMPAETNPLIGYEPPGLPESRDHKLDGEELAAVWRAAGDLGKPFGPLVRLLLILGQRREETAAIEWRELDRVSRTWTIPGAKTKNSKPHIVPLNDLAVAEIDGLAGKDGKRSDQWPRRGLIFTTTGETPVSGYSKAKSRLDKMIAKEEANRMVKGSHAIDFGAWRFHDLRRSLATGLQRLGVRFEVTEAVLNHISGSKSGVAGIYQRHDWADEKRAALDAWSNHIERLLSGADTDNVVRLATRV